MEPPPGIGAHLPKTRFSSDPPAGWKPTRSSMRDLYKALGADDPPPPAPPGSPPDTRGSILPEWLNEQNVDEQRKRADAARRAYVTLLARGTGSYVSPFWARKPEVPDYVATALPMICSFVRVRSKYQLVVLAANLTAGEHSLLRAVGGDSISIIDISRYQQKASSGASDAANAAAASPKGAAPLSCLITMRGSWMVHGRSDFASTMLKTAVWRELAGIYDQVAFVDADTIFIQSADVLFQTLDPHVRRGVRSCTYPNYCPHGVSWGRSRQWWQWPPSVAGKSGCGPGFPPTSRRRALCDELAFVAPESARERTAEQWNATRLECVRPGWQSGFFFTRPSVQMADALAARAASGRFSLFTQTEQDVIDAHFDPSEHCLRPDENSLSAEPKCTTHTRLSSPVMQSYAIHHKHHFFAIGAPTSPRGREYLKGNRMVQNLTLTLCPNHAALSPLNWPARAKLIQGSGGVVEAAQRLVAGLVPLPRSRGFQRLAAEQRGRAMSPG